MAGVEGFAFVAQAPKVPGSKDFCSRSNPIQPKTKKKAPDTMDLELFSWLGIKNDYRTLIGVDNLEIIEKADDEDEENSDV